jgi:hypothetical protein
MPLLFEISILQTRIRDFYYYIIRSETSLKAVLIEKDVNIKVKYFTLYDRMLYAVCLMMT